MPGDKSTGSSTTTTQPAPGMSQLVGNAQSVWRYDPDTATWTEDVRLSVAGVFGQIAFNGAQLFASETGELYLLTSQKPQRCRVG